MAMRCAELKPKCIVANSHAQLADGAVARDHVRPRHGLFGLHQSGEWSIEEVDLACRSPPARCQTTVPRQVHTKER